MAGITTTNFRDSDGVDLGRKLVTKDYLLEVYGTILENSPASGLVVTPSLLGWGSGTKGELGNGSASTSRTPVFTSAGGTNWKQVSGGDECTVAIKTDGTLWGWGINGSGQLGNNSTVNVLYTQVTTFAGGTDWKQVSANTFGAHTAAIKTDGSLWTWGANGSGQLGINNIDTRSIPITTFAGGNDWKQISCGSGHTAAIKTDGTLWIWGFVDFGRLGINLDTTSKSTPVTTFVGGNTWKSVSCGNAHTAAIKTDGTLWIWGRNSYGQLGINNLTQQNTPVTTFVGGTNWRFVLAGTNHTAAIKADGSLWTWGRNGQGQLGINNTTNKSTPVTTFAGGTNWKSVAGGWQHTVALKTDGTVWTWGWNDQGQLGINDNISRSTPVTTFAGGNDWKQITCGRQFSFGIRSNDYI
jgi:alpha-tubulin suppressor-like RCC1 family protein